MTAPRRGRPTSPIKHRTVQARLLPDLVEKADLVVAQQGLSFSALVKEALRWRLAQAPFPRRRGGRGHHAEARRIKRTLSLPTRLLARLPATSRGLHAGLSQWIEEALAEELTRITGGRPVEEVDQWEGARLAYRPGDTARHVQITLHPALLARATALVGPHGPISALLESAVLHRLARPTQLPAPRVVRSATLPEALLAQLAAPEGGLSRLLEETLAEYLLAPARPAPAQPPPAIPAPVAQAQVSPVQWTVLERLARGDRLTEGAPGCPRGTVRALRRRGLLSPGDPLRLSESGRLLFP